MSILQGENDKTKRRRISEAPTSFADLFGAPLSLEGKITGSNAPTASLVIDSDTIATGQTSSADLLSQIRQRQFRLGISLTPTSRSTDSSPLQPNQLDDIEGMEDPHTSLDGLSSDYSELIGEIRLFVAYDKGGEATTKEIVDKFGDRLPVGGSVIFKSMLKEICTFHRNNNCTDTGLWQIKPEFR